MKNLESVGRKKIKNIMDFCKMLNHPFPFKKLKFEAESWFAMNFVQVCSLCHNFQLLFDI